MSIQLVLIMTVAWVVTTLALATAVGLTLRSGGAVPVEGPRRERADESTQELVGTGR